MKRYCSVNITENLEPVELQAIASLENEICLFHKTIPTEVCKFIGSTMADIRARKMGAR